MNTNKILERVVMGADLPGEAVPGVPLIEIAGENRVIIENHKGVTGYSGTMICIKVSYGTVRVSGNSLTLARMTRQQLTITGIIDSVTLCRRQ